MNAVVRGASWLLTAFGMATAVVHQGIRPLTWRRSVRTEFWRFMDLACRRNLSAVLIAAALVGLSLVAQGLYWLQQFGQADTIGNVLIFVVVREIGPLIVGFLILGGAGIPLLVELAGLRTGGQLEVLNRQGVDPFLLLVVPRVLALTLAVFTHTVLFVVAALVTGYLMARFVGAVALPPMDFLAQMLTNVGTVGYAVLPAKSIATGLTIGCLCSLTAFTGSDGTDRRLRLVARGFLRGVSGILLVNGLLSLAL